MAETKTDPPSKGGEQNSPPPSGSGGEANADLAARLEELQRQLADKDTVIADRDSKLKSKDAEARRLQAAADQRASLLTRLQGQSNQMNPRPGAVRPGAPPAPQQQQTQGQELLDFANEQAKEVTLLREVLNRGLSLEDVEGIQFASHQELATQLDLMQQKKEIDELRAQLSKDKGGGSGEPPSGPKIDTGGRSRDEAQERLAGLNETRTQAFELKKQGQFQKATWLALEAARNDPERRTMFRPSEEEE